MLKLYKQGLGANKEESKKVFDLYYEKGGNFIGKFFLFTQLLLIFYYEDILMTCVF
jgi:hypothetical protein